METERCAAMYPKGVSLLPPSHALVDRQQRVKELDVLERAVVPAELEQLLGQVHALCTHCGADGAHLLAPLAREAGKLLQLHPHCAALSQCDAAAQAAAGQAAEEATAALRYTNDWKSGSRAAVCICFAYTVLRWLQRYVFSISTALRCDHPTCDHL